MTEEPGKILYKSKSPLLIHGLMLIALGMDIFALVIFLGGLLPGPGATPEARSLVLFATAMFIICIPLIITAYLEYQRAIIYENGITPAFQPIRSLVNRRPLFIPFKEIKLIGVRMRPVFGKMLPYYYFLMSDGSIVHCDNTQVGKETAVRLEEQLQRKCPGVKTVRIRLMAFEDGVWLKDFPNILK